MPPPSILDDVRRALQVVLSLFEEDARDHRALLARHQVEMLDSPTHRESFWRYMSPELSA